MKLNGVYAELHNLQFQEVVSAEAS
jgi:hypothetical protein